MRTLVCFFSVSLLFCMSCVGDVVWDEDVDGELSDDQFNPTVIAMGKGSNEIHGATNFDPLDRDFWTVTILPGFQLDSVVLQLYDTPEFQSWFAVEAGTQITSLNDPSTLLGGALIGGNAGSQQGDDVLDDLGQAIFGGTGFTGPLGPGTYSFWFQETGDIVNYEFDFIIVPEPTSLLLTTAFASVLVLRRRRK